MKNIRLHSELQVVVRDYLIFTQSTLDQQQELDKFLNLISPSLKLKVAHRIFDRILRDNPVLKQLPSLQTPTKPDGSLDLIESVIRKLGIQLNGPEDQIVI